MRMRPKSETPRRASSFEIPKTLVKRKGRSIRPRAFEFVHQHFCFGLEQRHYIGKPFHHRNLIAYFESPDSICSDLEGTHSVPAVGLASFVGKLNRRPAGLDIEDRDSYPVAARRQILRHIQRPIDDCVSGKPFF